MAIGEGQFLVRLSIFAIVCSASPCPGVTTTLAGFEAAGFGVSFGVLVRFLLRFGCRWRFGLGPLVGGGSTLTEAFSIHFEDGRVVDEAINGGDGHGLVGEDLIPTTEGLIGRDGDAAVFVTPGDQFEEDAGFGLILVGICDVVEDDQVELVEFRQRCLENEITAGGLKFLHQIAGPGVEVAVPCLDQVEAMTLADRIVVLEFDKIAQVGCPRELYEWPANLFVAQFIGSPRMNVFSVGAAPEVPMPKEAVSLGVRPEHIELVETGSGQIQGKVDVLEYLGADTYVIMSCGEAGQITVRVNGSTSYRPGEKAGLAFATDHMQGFDIEGLAVPLV